MSRWTIEQPTALDFAGVVALKVLLASGNLSVLATEDRPSVQVNEVTGRPIEVSHEAGMLDITHENVLWEGMLGWLRDQRSGAGVTVTVPADCPVQVNLVNADAIISGLTSGVSIKSGTGDVTLDGVTGHIDANTMAGIIEARELNGTVNFTSISGDLALAGGSIDRLTARSVSGRIAADVDLLDHGRIQASTVSGEVTLRLAASTSARIALSTVAGRIDTSFPELDSAERAIPRNVTGELGDATGEVTVNTVSGTITLLSRPDDDARREGGPDVEV